MQADLFERIFHQISDCGHTSFLADAVDAVEGLLFDHGVPVRFHEIGAGCSCEV